MQIAHAPLVQAWQVPLTQTWPVAHGCAASHCGQPPIALQPLQVPAEVQV